MLLSVALWMLLGSAKAYSYSFERSCFRGKVIQVITPFPCQIKMHCLFIIVLTPQDHERPTCVRNMCCGPLLCESSKYERPRKLFEMPRRLLQQVLSLCWGEDANVDMFFCVCARREKFGHTTEKCEVSIPVTPI